MSALLLNSRAESHTANSSPTLRITVFVKESDSSNSTAEKETDEELVAKAKSGDQPAFAELCRRYAPVLRKKIYRIVRNYHDTEDITQESLITAYTRLSNLRCDCSFRSWLARIAINSSLIHLRKKRLHPHVSMDLPSTEGEQVRSWEFPDYSPNPEQLYDAYQTSMMLAHAVERLPRSFRQVVELYHRDEAALVDVANDIGISVGAVKSRLLRARKLIRRRLKPVSRRTK
jgi:RNA polymerase sigma-70 factor (ECF subfamily)